MAANVRLAGLFAAAPTLEQAMKQPLAETLAAKLKTLPRWDFSAVDEGMATFPFGNFLRRDTVLALAAQTIEGGERETLYVNEDNVLRECGFCGQTYKGHGPCGCPEYRLPTCESTTLNTPAAPSDPQTLPQEKGDKQ
jgi:hypothetical protein